MSEQVGNQNVGFLMTRLIFILNYYIKHNTSTYSIRTEALSLFSSCPDRDSVCYLMDDFLSIYLNCFCFGILKCSQVLALLLNSSKSIVYTHYQMLASFMMA